jgi:hypothetical protein
LDFNTEEAECAEKNVYRELSEELTMLKDLGDFGSRSLFDLLFPIDHSDSISIRSGPFKLALINDRPESQLAKAWLGTASEISSMRGNHLY